MLIAQELERRVLVPLFDRQEEAPERCCLITTAASRQRARAAGVPGMDTARGERRAAAARRPQLPALPVTRGAAAFPQRACPSGASESHDPRLSA